MLPVATSEEKLSVHLYRSYPSFVIKRFSHTTYMIPNRSTYILIVINHIDLIQQSQILYLNIDIHKLIKGKTIPYRSKKELTGQVRITQFPGADMCACCGTHVSRSGQVGLVKFLSVQKFREGVRIELLCGKRALEYLSKTWEQAKAIGQRLSVKPVDSEAAVERLEGELTSLKLRCAQLEESVFESMAKEQAGKGNVLLFQPAMRPDSVRRLMDAVSKTCGGLAAVFAGEEGHYAYALGRADGQDISPLVKTMNTVLHGRGGGRNGFAQGSVETERSAIESFFKENGYGICD